MENPGPANSNEDEIEYLSFLLVHDKDIGMYYLDYLSQ